MTSLRVGHVECVRRTFTQSDFDRFAALSGDDNPIHVDPDFAARTSFGRTVAHGMLLYSVVCGVLGTRLPGPGTIQLEQELMFPTATPAGEEVEICVEVERTCHSGCLLDLSTIVIRPDGNRGLQGVTRVCLPEALSWPGGGSTSPELPVSGDSSLKGIELGQRAQTRRAFSAADLVEYADLSGDSNPIYTDASYTKEQGLEAPLVPGALLGGLLSYLLGTELPGRGTNYLKQKLRFVAPAFVGETLAASVEVVRIRADKQLINLRTVCSKLTGKVVCLGEALVLVRDAGHAD